MYILKFGSSFYVFFQDEEKLGLPSLPLDFSITFDVANNFSLFRKSSLFRAHTFYMSWVFLPLFLASPLLKAICFKYRPAKCKHLYQNGDTYRLIAEALKSAQLSPQHRDLTQPGYRTQPSTWEKLLRPYCTNAIYEELTVGQRLQVQ